MQAPLVRATLALSLALGLPSLPALAATSSAVFDVAVTVHASCVMTTSSLVFGLYAGAQKDATSTVTVTCTNTTRYDVGVNTGQHAGSTTTSWRMAGPAGALLSYQIYVDAARSVFWGASPGNDAVAGVGNGKAQLIYVYGRVAANQYVVPGAYADTVTFTLYF
jgi:spore coat protein U-like protein